MLQEEKEKNRKLLEENQVRANDHIEYSRKFNARTQEYEENFKGSGKFLGQ